MSGRWANCGIGAPMRLEQQDVLGRVGEVVLAPDDVADGHRGVVHGHGEVVQRRSVRAHDHEVAAEGVGVDLDVAADDVVEGDRPVSRDAEADDGLAALGLERGALGRRQVGAAAVVARRLAGPPPGACARPRAPRASSSSSRPCPRPAAGRRLRRSGPGAASGGRVRRRRARARRRCPGPRPSGCPASACRRGCRARTPRWSGPGRCPRGGR